MNPEPLKSRRWIAAGVVGVLAVGLAIFAYVRVIDSGNRNCTLIGGVNNLFLDVPADFRSEAGTIRVSLRQGDEARSVEFVPKGTNKYGSYIEQGVFFEAGMYAVALGGDGISPSGLGADWDPADRATVVVTGFGLDGRAAFRHRETVAFDRLYPNGKDSDGDGYFATKVSVTTADAL